MININKYNTNDAYATDGNRPAGECCVSLVDNSVVYDAKNVVKLRSQLSKNEVCMVVKDTVDGIVKYIPVATFDPTTFDTTRYQLKDWIRFGETKGKQLHIYKKNTADTTWAAPNRYKIECDTIATGGFHWAITINGSVKEGDVAWAASDTLASIAAQINAVANIATVVDGEEFVRVTVNSYSNSTLTLTANTGGTLTDLSVFCKVGGVAQEETHRTWQAQSVAALFPTLGFLAANSVQYAKNGYNLSYWCGGNLARYKAYCRANGSATWVAENAVGRMNETAFNSCADGTIGGADGIALYNKYNGSWDAYIAAGMVQIDDVNAGGIEYQSYDNGLDQTEKLCSVTTMDFDGTYVPAYPAAAAAKISDVDFAVEAHLPTTHEGAKFMEDDTYNAIRTGLSHLSGSGLISNTGYYWFVSEYNAHIAWSFSGYNGTLIYGSKSNGLSVRPVLAF